MNKIDEAKEMVEDLGELAEAIKKNFAWVKPTIMSIIILLGGGTVLENNGTIDYTPIGEGDDWAWEEEYYPYYGCIDQIALNYDEYADTDDGNCYYDHPDHEGMSCNDEHSDISHEEWAESKPVYGCTDDTANNYDTTATDDDGSCEYDSEPENCEPYFYDNYTGYSNNNTEIFFSYDVDLNCNETQDVTVQFLAYKENSSQGEFPENYSTDSFEVYNADVGYRNITLGNFSKGKYDIYVYLTNNDGEVITELIWLGIEIEGDEE